MIKKALNDENEPLFEMLLNMQELETIKKLVSLAVEDQGMTFELECVLIQIKCAIRNSDYSDDFLPK